MLQVAVPYSLRKDIVVDDYEGKNENWTLKAFWNLETKY